MRSGQPNVAEFNPGSYPLAVCCAGFVHSGIIAYDHGEYGDETEIIVEKGNDITPLADIKGRKMAFDSPLLIEV